MLYSHILALGFAVLASASPSPIPHNKQKTPTPAPPPIAVTRIISAVEDKAKVDRLSTLLTAYVEEVKANEPGTQVFEVDLDRKRSEFLTYEVYDDKKAQSAHDSANYLVDLEAAVGKEQLVRKAPEIYNLDLTTRYIRAPVEPKE